MQTKVAMASVIFKSGGQLAGNVSDSFSCFVGVFLFLFCVFFVAPDVSLSEANVSSCTLG